MSKAVLDASALLALLNSEPGAEIVAENLTGACISAVNFAEVVGKLGATGMPEKEIRGILGPLGLEIVPFDTEQAYLTGLLHGTTRRMGLSLGDRACLSLGRNLGLLAFTADKRWEKLSPDIAVNVIR